MQQPTFGSLEFAADPAGRPRRERLLERLESLVQLGRDRGRLRVEPVYPKLEARTAALGPDRACCAFTACSSATTGSEPAIECTLLYEAESNPPLLTELNLSEPIPDEWTILHFRHLLERHQLGERAAE